VYGGNFLDLRAIRDDRYRGTRVGQEVADLCRCERWVHRHRHATGGQHRQVGEAPFQTTLSDHSNAITGDKAEFAEAETEVADS
jgi:hypothetical protein